MHPFSISRVYDTCGNHFVIRDTHESESDDHLIIQFKVDNAVKKVQLFADLSTIDRFAGLVVYTDRIETYWYLNG